MPPGRSWRGTGRNRKRGIIEHFGSVSGIVAICSCNDGLRPVIFRLEATDEESVIGYTPVR